MKRKRACSEGGDEWSRGSPQESDQVQERYSFPRQYSLPPLSTGRVVDSLDSQDIQHLPLTRDNLRCLQQSLNNDSSSMPSSPIRKCRSDKTTSGGKSDSANKLPYFGVFYDQETPIPSELKQHISNLRVPRQIASPNAKQIVQKTLKARTKPEQDGIDTLRNLLLLVTADEGGAAFVERAANTNFNAHFLPPAPFPIPERMVLEIPQPDNCFGYLPAQTALVLKLEAPFTAAEERILNRFSLTKELHFPFLTAQWKSPAKGQTHHQAIPQAARDGSTIVNYLHPFYTATRPTQTLSLIKICHFSITIDMRTAILWGHWREQDKDGIVRYRMEEVEKAWLNEESDNMKIRTMLRNLQDYAVGERLSGIKKLLPALWDHLENAASEQTAIGATPPLATEENASLLKPPTPSSDSMPEPMKKRKKI